jgi:hypothetical protein
MNFSSRTLSAVTLVCLAAPLLPAQSGTPAPFVPMPNPDPRIAQSHAGASHIKAPGNVAISPDGTLIAYTLRGDTSIHLKPYPATAAEDKLVTAGPNCFNYDPSPTPPRAEKAMRPGRIRSTSTPAPLANPASSPTSPASSIPRLFRPTANRSHSSSSKTQPVRPARLPP